MISAAVSSYSGQRGDNAVYLLTQPYLAKESLTVDSVSIASDVALSAAGETKLLQVQVQSGKKVHYEITPSGATLREATTDSPIISGDETLHFCGGFRISFIEAS